MAAKPKDDPNACQARTGTVEQQDPAGKDQGDVVEAAEDEELEDESE